MERRLILPLMVLCSLLSLARPILANPDGTDLKRNYVEIYKCSPSPYTVEVMNGGFMHWLVKDTLPDGDTDTAQYRVHFDPKKNPIPGPDPVTSLKLTDNPHLVNVPNCTAHDTTGCGLFPYSLKQTKPGSLETDCKDPVVRVEPPPGDGALLANSRVRVAEIIAFVILLIFLAFILFRPK